MIKAVNTNPFPILETLGRAPYPTLNATVTQYRPQGPELPGRLNGYRLCSIICDSEPKTLATLSRDTNFEIQFNRKPRSDISSELILYNLLKIAGLEQKTAARVALEFPDPHMFHPVRGNDPHNLADLLLFYSAVTDPIEGLLYLAKRAKPVSMGRQEYGRGVARLYRSMDKYR